MTPELQRCDDEIASAEALLRGGHPDVEGLRMTIGDWRTERRLILKAPFPWFGGKSKVADIVWDRFGNVPNYCEPFFGSGAVLLGRPHAPSTETINDLDCMVANFWRAVQNDPDVVAEHADNPVNEADQHARHLWLCSQEEFRERMKTEPDFYDSKIAGWWVWGQCIWIGSGWCSVQLPHLGDAGTLFIHGVYARTCRKIEARARLLWELGPHLRPFVDFQAWAYGCLPRSTLCRRS